MQEVPTWLEVDLDKVLANVDAIQAAIGPDVKLLLTIKADAYGHGAVEVARACEGRVERFGVATVDEALELRRARIATRILILSPILDGEIPLVVDNGFAVTLSSVDFAERISAYSARRGIRTEVHVEVDTGMGRTGFLPDDAREVIQRLPALAGIELGGVFTHFPVSDTDEPFTSGQLAAFGELIAALEAAGFNIPITHCANSAALSTIRDSHLQMVRPGLLVYGHLPPDTPGTAMTESVLSWKARIVQVRKLPPGRSVSYGRTFTTQRHTVMGVIPVGYGHGYPFRLGGKGVVLVHGRRVPILGRVTMDMTMVDLTDVASAPGVGDEVVLIGQQGGDTISVDELAAWCGTISYEIFCGISKRVPRLYYRHGRVRALRSLLGVIPDAVGS